MKKAKPEPKPEAEVRVYPRLSSNAGWTEAVRVDKIHWPESGVPGKDSVILTGILACDMKIKTHDNEALRIRTYELEIILK